MLNPSPNATKYPSWPWSLSPFSELSCSKPLPSENSRPYWALWPEYHVTNSCWARVYTEGLGRALPWVQELLCLAFCTLHVFAEWKHAPFSLFPKTPCSLVASRVGRRERWGVLREVPVPRLVGLCDGILQGESLIYHGLFCSGPSGQSNRQTLGQKAHQVKGVDTSVEMGWGVCTSQV